MSTELSISQILSLAKICEYLSVVKSAYDNAFKGGGINERLARLIYMERTAVQNRYNINPNDPTLIGTANYLFSILEYQGQAQTLLNNLAQSPPIITGPSNQSVLVGATAVFSVNIVSALSYTVQWYRNGILIPGATGLSYSLANAQLTDSGALFSVTATNAAGSISSTQATLTVSVALIALTWYGAADPGPNLQASIDNLTYQITTNITHNQPISITIPLAATPNMFFATKVPIAESIKTTWFNTALNSGSIPDANYQSYIQFNGFTYYYSRTAISLDSTQPLILT